MFNLSYNEVVGKIQDSTNLTQDEINQRVEEKLKKLADLVSKEGAAHILANELNVKIFENIPKDLKIEKLIPGMSAVNIIGKVANVFDIREYNKDGRSGKIGSLTLGDETGVTRLVLWDTNHISLIEKSEIAKDKVLDIKNAYVKQGYNNLKELHIGNKGSIEFSNQEITIDPKHLAEGLENGFSIQNTIELKKINEVKEQEVAKINGNLVYMFEPRYYDACSECNKKVENGSCLQHSNASVKKTPVLNFYLDDGSANIKVVAFRDQANSLMNGHANDSGEINYEKLKEDILGNQYSINGRVVRNSFSNDIEMIANNIDTIDTNKELKNTVENIEAN
ncbi:hypothetical protein CL617_00850 [archaeon]|nr:hypothetical protein [archaeon]